MNNVHLSNHLFNMKDWSNLFDRLSDIVVIYQIVDGGVVYAYLNPPAQKLVSLDSIGKRIENVHPSEYAQSLISKLHEIVLTKQPAQFIDLQSVANGRALSDGYFSPVLDEAGECSHIIGLVKDITFLVEQQEEMQIQYEFMEAFMRCISDAVIIYFPDHRVLRVNHAFETIFGWKEEEVYGKGIDENPLFPDHEREQAEMYLEAMKSGEHVPTIFTKRLRKDGTLIDVSISMSPILNSRGEIVALSSIHRDITEARAASELIRTTKEELELIWNYTTDALFLMAQDGSRLKVNPALLRMFGWSEEEVKEGEFAPYLPEESRQEYPLLIDQLRRGENFLNLPQRRIRKNEEIIDVLVSYRPINKGNILAVGTYTDVTELNKIHHALNHSKERYKKLVQCSPDAIIVVTNGNIVFINPFGANLLKDDDVNHLLGSSILSFIDPDLQEQFSGLMTKIALGEHAWETVNTRFVRRDGTVIDVEVVGVDIIYEDEPSIQLVIRDISERLRSERALEESEAKYRLIAENMSDLIAIYDVQGLIQYASPSHHTVLGLPVEKVQGNAAFNMIHPEEVRALQKTFQDIVQAKEPRQAEFRFKHANGDWVHVEAKYSPVISEQDEVDNIVIVARDVTERKKYTQLLKEMAFTDTLTGLPNRRILKERSEQALVIARRQQHSIGLLFLDIDKFKEINDTLGHDTGDELLIQFAELVKRCIRSTDMLCRLGGDEFVILLPNVFTKQDAFHVAERIIHSLQEPLEAGGQYFQVTSSIGVAISEADDTVDTLLKRADQALYRAKENGRNNYMFDLKEDS